MIPGVLLPAIPFAVALIGLLLPLHARKAAAALGVTGAAGALAVAIVAVAADKTEESREWVRIGDLSVTFGVRMDHPAALVAVAVGVVALAVQVYSITYLADDERYPPYAAQVSLFTAAMLLVVVAGDLIMLLVGWEVMGICSYLLIGHDRRLPEAPAAAVKAFIVTRVGDVAFLIGLGLLGIAAGSFRIADVLAHDYSATTLTVAGLLLLAGVAGKSAQFPLHTWLPDAMAGPTPISALIHAATMVAAGIYVVTRLYPVFDSAALAVLGVMAAITLLLGALAATAQDDIKRVLAWSTVSQIGYMAGALAVGSPPAALFHLLTHAAFKALLFLAAGSVIHAVGSNLMSRMGGLRREMPVTFWSFVIGLGALAGLPPLAGFWSKEAIINAAHHGPVAAPEWVGWVVWLATLTGVAITAWYSARLLKGTFFGEARTHGHEAPPLMRWPVALLAIPSALLGLAIFWPDFRANLGLGEPHLDAWLLLPLALLAAGAAVGWRGVPTVPAFARAFWLDEVQHFLLVRPAYFLARVVRHGDEAGVDGVVEGTGSAAVRLGRRLATAHRTGLPRAATAVLAAAVLLAALGVIL